VERIKSPGWITNSNGNVIISKKNLIRKVTGREKFKCNIYASIISKLKKATTPKLAKNNLFPANIFNNVFI
jgi:hypothetical protein